MEDLLDWIAIIPVSDRELNLEPTGKLRKRNAKDHRVAQHGVIGIELSIRLLPHRLQPIASDRAGDTRGSKNVREVQALICRIVKFL